MPPFQSVSKVYSITSKPNIKSFSPNRHATLARRINIHKKELLNEAIQDTSRTLAFLHREQKRLTICREDQQHPLTLWAEHTARKIYSTKRHELRRHLSAKLARLTGNMNRPKIVPATSGLHGHDLRDSTDHIPQLLPDQHQIAPTRSVTAQEEDDHDEWSDALCLGACARLHSI